MAQPTAHLAIDLGAESGRAIVGVLGGDRVDLHEVHRFSNTPLHWPDGWHWDVGGLWKNVVHGVAAAAHWCATHQVGLVSVGVDAWGVDFGLLGQSGELLALPRCYRDERFVAARDRVLDHVGSASLYRTTGIQVMPFNTIFQLSAMKFAEPALLDTAKDLLFIPDLFHYLLTGRSIQERSIASTSQLLHGVTGGWALELLAELGIPMGFLHEVIEPASEVGKVLPNLAQEHQVPANLMVIAPAGHDTACAVAAVPAEEGSEWCYLSSGTWSLLGVELCEPCMTDLARLADFTNERGIGGTVRFLKNIVGLWILQECRRVWESEGQAASYSELTRLAATEAPFRTIIDVTRSEFLPPGDMPGKIRRVAEESGQPQPATQAQITRCVLESLALSYRITLRCLEHVLGRRFSVIHVVGGGSSNSLLNQMTADATGRRVLAGPTEAAAMGNVLIQALGMGELGGAREIRRVVRASLPLAEFRPGNGDLWEEAESRLINTSLRTCRV